MPKLTQLLSLIFLSSLAFIISACVTIEEATTCSTLGLLEFPGGCSHWIGPGTFTITTKEIIDLLDAQPNDRTCVPLADLPVCAEDQSHGTPVLLKKRAASIIMTAEQWNGKKTELEASCRYLGKNCKYAPGR